MRRVFAAAALAAIAVPAARADTLEGRLAKMPLPQLTSAKSLDALEFCLGVGIGNYFLPSTLRGEGQVFVYAGVNTELTSVIYSAVLVKDEGARRTVSYQAPKAWAQKTEALVQRCV